MSRRDPGAALAARLVAAAAEAGCAATIHAATVREWASATFAGHRHRLTLEASGPDVDAWLAGLADADWTLADHLVADVAVASAEAGRDTAGRLVVVEVLTLRDAAVHHPSHSV